MASARSPLHPYAYRVLWLSVGLITWCSALQVGGWTSSPFDDVYGPDGWKTFAPLCPSMGADVETTTQYSPIQFNEDEANTAPKIVSMCATRQFPYVQVPYDIGSSSLWSGKELLRKPQPALVLDLNPGGSLRARCDPKKPLFLSLYQCGAKGGLDDVLLSQMLELKHIIFFNGVMHTFPDMDLRSSGGFFEVEFHFIIAKLKEESSTEKLDDATYIPQCEDALVDRIPAELIISVILTPSATQVKMNNSIIADIFLNIQNFETQVAANSGALYTVPSDVPVFPMLSTDVKNSAMGFYFYEGSLGEPPCTPAVKRMVLSTILTVPSSMLDLLSSVSGTNWNSFNALQRKRLSTTKMYQGRLYQIKMGVEAEDVIHQVVTTVKPKESTATFEMDDRLLWLTVLDLLLFAVALIMVLSRWELLSILPSGFGGLNSRVQWDEHSYKKAAELEYIEQCDRERHLEQEQSRAQRESATRKNTLSDPQGVARAAEGHGSSSWMGQRAEDLIGSTAPQSQDEVAPLFAPTTSFSANPRGPQRFSGATRTNVESEAVVSTRENPFTSSHAGGLPQWSQPTVAATSVDPTKEFHNIMSGVDSSRCL